MLARLQSGERLPLQGHRLANLRAPLGSSTAVVQCSHHITGSEVDLVDENRDFLSKIPAGYSLWVLGTQGVYDEVAEYSGQDQEEEDDSQEDHRDDEGASRSDDEDAQGSESDADDAIGFVRSNRLLRQPAPRVAELGVVPRSWTKAHGPLLGRKGPRMKDVRQGDLNDCFFLAPLAAIAGTPRGKALIADILRDRGDGSFSARFAALDDDNQIGAREEVVVDRWLPSDKSGKPLYNQPQHSLAEELPIWAALLEKAYAQWDEDGYAGLNMAAASRAIAHLTGLEPESLEWDTESKSVLGRSELDWAQDTFRQEELEDIEAEREDVASQVDDTQDVERPRPVKDIDAVHLHAMLRAAKRDPNAVLVAESRSEGDDHTSFLDKQKQVRDSHVYVIREVYKDQSLLLWDPITGNSKRLGADKFREFFSRVLRASLAKVG